MGLNERKFKYSVYTIQTFSIFSVSMLHLITHLIYAIRHFIHFFSFFFCVEFDTYIIRNFWKYKIALVNARERFSYYCNNFFKKRRSVALT